MLYVKATKKNTCIYSRQRRFDGELYALQVMKILTLMVMQIFQIDFT